LSAGATRIIAIRHGETDWNAGSRLQGHQDVPLNDLGRRQAARLAEALADEGITAVISSDLGRAAETARAFALPLGLPLSFDPGLRERGFGLLEGHTYGEIEQRFPDMALRWRARDPGFGPPGGESLSDFFARSVATATRWAAAHAGSTVALVTHGGVLDCLYRAALRLELQAPRTWQLGNAAVNRLLYTGDGFSVVGWNDHQHLAVLVRDDAAA
jgi:2,3-bisphosphoglycerate-dependent phosphoglycerate mutase